MTLRATVEALLVAFFHSRVHGCGFLGAGCTGNIGGMVPVCVGVGTWGGKKLLKYIKANLKLHLRSGNADL